MNAYCIRLPHLLHLESCELDIFKKPYFATTCHGLKFNQRHLEQLITFSCSQVSLTFEVANSIARKLSKNKKGV